MHGRHSPKAQNAVIDNRFEAIPSIGTGPLFDFHQVFTGSHTGIASNTFNLAATPDIPPTIRKPAQDKDDTMSYVDAHSMGRCRDWLSVDHKPYAPKPFVSARNAPRREASTSNDTVEISAMTRSERIRLLEAMETSQDRGHLEAMPGTHVTVRRAHQERLISGRVRLPGQVPYGGAAPSNTQEASQDTKGGKSSSSLLTFHMKAAQQNPDYEIDDGFSKAVEAHRAALRGTDKVAECAVRKDAHKPADRAADSERTPAAASNNSPGRRHFSKISPKRRTLESLHHDASLKDDNPDVERMTSWLTELGHAVDEDMSTDVFQVACISQASLFARLSEKLRRCAYILRPQDALRAVVLLAKSASLLKSYERAAVTTKHDAETYKVGIAHEDALASVRLAMEAILAAVAMRITAAEAAYVAEVLLAMAETHAGRQEYLDAILGHMLWLLSAKPRSFQPRVVSRIIWALGRLKVEGGADGETLQTGFCKEANRRAISALRARLLEVLDDFLEEDIGTLAQDPTGGAHLGDDELRRVLHRAGRLQVGLRPESEQFLGAMQRLEASARARLWEPFQAEVMPFMRDYCEQLSATLPADQSALAFLQVKQQSAWLPPSLR